MITFLAKLEQKQWSRYSRENLNRRPSVLPRCQTGADP